MKQATIAVGPAEATADGSRAAYWSLNNLGG